MGGVGRGQLQAMRERQASDHRISQADGLADSFQVASDAAS